MQCGGSSAGTQGSKRISPRRTFPHERALVLWFPARQHLVACASRRRPPSPSLSSANSNDSVSTYTIPRAGQVRSVRADRRDGEHERTMRVRVRVRVRLGGGGGVAGRDLVRVRWVHLVRAVIRVRVRAMEAAGRDEMSALGGAGTVRRSSYASPPPPLPDGTRAVSTC